MSKGTYPLKLPKSIKEAAAKLAKDDGVSLNRWIASAVAQKIGSVETAERFVERRKGQATGDDLGRYLDRVRDASPMKGDELAAGKPPRQ